MIFIILLIIKQNENCIFFFRHNLYKILPQVQVETKLDLLITNTTQENWEESKFNHLAVNGVGYNGYAFFVVNTPIIRIG